MDMASNGWRLAAGLLVAMGLLAVAAAQEDKPKSCKEPLRQPACPAHHGALTGWFSCAHSLRPPPRVCPMGCSAARLPVAPLGPRAHSCCFPLVRLYACPGAAAAVAALPAVFSTISSPN